jgi:hypothetical protein
VNCGSGIQRRPDRCFAFTAATGTHFVKGEYERVKAAPDGTVVARTTDWGKVMIDLHTGKIGGEIGKTIMTGASALLLLLLVSGSLSVAQAAAHPARKRPEQDDGYDACTRPRRRRAWSARNPLDSGVRVASSLQIRRLTLPAHEKIVAPDACIERHVQKLPVVVPTDDGGAGVGALLLAERPRGGARPARTGALRGERRRPVRFRARPVARPSVRRHADFPRPA